MTDNISVGVRVRPLSKRESEQNCQPKWVTSAESIQLLGDPHTSYTYDHVFDENNGTRRIYSQLVERLVESCMNGYNSTIFAYGQTGSGKTHTIMGVEDEWGIIPYAIRQIFDHIEQNPDREYLLRVSFLELYMEELTDLLTGDIGNKDKLKIRSHSNGEVYVENLKELFVNETDEILKLLEGGQNLRHVAETALNDRSSRSHTIFQIIIESRETNTDEPSVQMSKLNIVDLAGSERSTSAKTSGDRFKEGNAINTSLLTLGRVISQLADNKDFISFRDSKLTRILQSSLGGNAKTAVICTVSPHDVSDTLSTLKFASNAKKIQNKPVVNCTGEDSKLNAYRSRITSLVTELEELRSNKEAQAETHLVSEQRVKALERDLENMKKFLLSTAQLPLCDDNVGWMMPANSAASHAKALKAKAKRRQTWCPGLLAHPKISPSPRPNRNRYSEQVVCDSADVSFTPVPISDVIDELENREAEWEAKADEDDSHGGDRPAQSESSGDRKKLDYDNGVSEETNSEPSSVDGPAKQPIVVQKEFAGSIQSHEEQLNQMGLEASAVDPTMLTYSSQRSYSVDSCNSTLTAINPLGVSPATNQSEQWRQLGFEASAVESCETILSGRDLTSSTIHDLSSKTPIASHSRMKPLSPGEVDSPGSRSVPKKRTRRSMAFVSGLKPVIETDGQEANSALDDDYGILSVSTMDQQPLLSSTVLDTSELQTSSFSEPPVMELSKRSIRRSIVAEVIENSQMAAEMSTQHTQNTLTPESVLQESEKDEEYKTPSSSAPTNDAEDQENSGGQKCKSDEITRLTAIIADLKSKVAERDECLAELTSALDSRERSYRELKSFQVHELEMAEKDVPTTNRFPSSASPFRVRLDSMMGRMEAMEVENKALKSQLAMAESQDYESIIQDLKKDLCDREMLLKDNLTEMENMKEASEKAKRGLEFAKRDAVDYKFMFEDSKAKDEQKYKDLFARYNELVEEKQSNDRILQELRENRTEPTIAIEVQTDLSETKQHQEMALNAANLENDQLKAENERTKTELESKLTLISNLEGEINELAQQVKSLESAQRDVAEFRKETEKLAIALEKSNKEFETVKRLSEEKDKEIKRVKADSEAERLEQTDLIEKIIFEKTEIEETVLSLKSDKEKAEIKTEEMFKTLNELKTQMENLNIEKEELNQELKQSDTDSRLTISSITTQLDILQARFDDQQKESAAALEEKERRVEDMKIKNEELEKRVEETCGMIKTLESDAGTALERIHLLERENESLSSQVTVSKENADASDNLNQQIEEISGMLKKKEDELADVKAKVQSLEGEKASLSLQLAASKQESAAALEEKERRVEDMKIKNEELEKRVEETCGMIKTLESDAGTALERIHLLERENESLSSQVTVSKENADASDNLNQQIEEISGMLKKKEDELADVKAKVQNLEGEKASLSLQLAASKQESAAALEEKERRVEDMRIKNEEMEKRVEETCGMIKTLESDAGTALERIHLLERENESLSSQVTVSKENADASDNLNQQIEEISGMLKKKEDELADVKAKVQSLEGEKASLSSQLAAFKQDYTSSLSQIDELNLRIQEKSETLKAKEDELEAAVSSISNLKEENSSLTSQLAISKVDLNAAEKYSEDLDRKVQEAEKLLKEKEDELTSKILLLKDENATLTVQLSDIKETTTTNLLEMNQKLEKSLTNLKVKEEELAAGVIRIQSLEEEAKALTSEVVSCKANLDDALKTVLDLEQKIREAAEMLKTKEDDLAAAVAKGQKFEDLADSLTSQRATNTADLESAAKQIEDLNQQVKKVSETLKLKEEELTVKNSKIQDLESQSSSANASKEELDTALKALKDLNQKAQESSDALKLKEDERAAAILKIQKLESDNSVLATELAATKQNLDSAVEELNGKIQEQSQLIKAKEDNLLEKTAKLQKMENEISSFATQSSQHTTQFKKLNQVNGDLRNRIIELETIAEQQKDEVEKARMEIAESKSDQSVQEELKKMKKDNDRLKRNLVSAKNSCADADEVEEQLRKTIQEYKLKMDETVAHSEAMKKDLIEQGLEASKFKSQLQDLEKNFKKREAVGLEDLKIRDEKIRALKDQLRMVENSGDDNTVAKFGNVRKGRFFENPAGISPKKPSQPSLSQPLSLSEEISTGNQDRLLHKLKKELKEKTAEISRLRLEVSNSRAGDYKSGTDENRLENERVVSIGDENAAAGSSSPFKNPSTPLGQHRMSNAVPDAKENVKLDKMKEVDSVGNLNVTPKEPKTPSFRRPGKKPKGNSHQPFDDSNRNTKSPGCAQQ